MAMHNFAVERNDSYRSSPQGWSLEDKSRQRPLKEDRWVECSGVEKGKSINVNVRSAILGKLLTLRAL